MKAVLTLFIGAIVVAISLSTNAMMDSMDRTAEVQALLKDREAAETANDVQKIKVLDKKLEQIKQDTDNFLESTSGFELFK